MIASIKRYAGYFAGSLLTNNTRRLLVRDFGSWYFSKSFSRRDYPLPEKRAALDKAVAWLLFAQKKGGDPGFCTYRAIEGWTSSYPETSGYILSTLVEYVKLTGKTEILENAAACADWLLSIQKPSGGWQSMYVENNKPEVVFNTAQVVRGLVDLYTAKTDQNYLNAAVKACDWLCSVQEEDGSWKKFAFMNQHRVYDSYVDSPLLKTYSITKNELYRKTAMKNLEWIVEKKQKNNAWFEDCDNTIKHNQKPITHTLAYTIDGLLECGLILEDERFILAAKKASDVLLDLYTRQGFLNGRYDRNWKGSEYMICTGNAQLAITWLKFYKLYKNGKYLYAAAKMNNLLTFIQDHGRDEDASTCGAIQGSFPLWGKYEPFAFPNWATKYFADSLMMEINLNKQ